MRLPSASTKGPTSSRSCSSLAERLVLRTLSSLTNRGSQHTWRSLSGAPSITVPEAARPRAGHRLLHPLVLGQAQALVEPALGAARGDLATGLGLLRQLGEHLLLGPAQHQRGDAPGEPLAQLDVALFLDGRASA